MTKRKRNPDEQILTALAAIDHPERQYHGLTEEDLFTITRLEPKVVKARVAALVKQGMIRDTYLKRAGIKSRSLTLWAISPKALPLFKEKTTP